MSARIDIPEEKIEEFCRQNGIKRLSLFGSVLRDDVPPESDIDVLVEFKAGRTPGLAFFGSIPDDLSEILGRRVDLNTVQCLSPYFRQKVLEEAVEMTHGCTRADLDENRMLNLAVIRLVEIVGDSCSRIPKEFRDEHPEIPWREISGVRIKLAHAYDSIDFDILWDIVENDLPILIEQLKAIVGERSD